MSVRAYLKTLSGCHKYSEKINLQEYILPITSNSSCAPTTQGACEQVCEQATVTYSVYNPDELPVIWTVTGAASYTTQGDQVLVNWGNAGVGQVTVEMPKPCSSFYVTCGQVAPALDINGTGSLAIRSILQGCTTQNLFWSTDGVFYSQISSMPLPLDGPATFTTYSLDEDFNDESPGTWTHNYVKNWGMPLVKPCTYDITEVGEPNIFIQLQGVTQPHNCTDCQGKIDFTVFSELPIASTILKNMATGEILNNLDNLCTGTYSITAIDVSGLVKTEEVVISCDFPCEKKGSVCVEVLHHPTAIFTTDPIPTNGILDLCKGQKVQFTNISTEAPNTEWDFGDGTVSVQDDPLHTFAMPGIYEVKLIARNGCNCADTVSMTVIVNDAEIPAIQCIGPICQGDSATYRTNVTCGVNNWNIGPNGSIIGGGSTTDDFVTVLWQNGNTGLVELSVSSCAGNICDKPVRELVSILGGPVSIDGPDVVCPNTAVDYSIPDYEGSEIVWSVSGDGNLIIEGQGTHKIKIQWGDGPGGIVSINYNNCFLECAGSGTKPVQIKQPSYIDGPIEVCIGDNPTFKHKSLANNALLSASWQLLDASNSLVWWSNGTPSQVSPIWDFPPGQYNLRAFLTGSNNGSCTAEAGLPITLFPTPEVPNISGEMQVCPTLIYTYTAQTTLANASFEWEIKNGTTTTQKTGNSINIKWGNSPPYALTLWQTDETGPGCVSNPTTFEAQPIPTLTISGPDLICKETSANYATQSLPNIEYEWEIEPSTAGAVLAGQGTPNIEVFWQTPGLASVKLIACGGIIEFEAEVIAPALPTVSFPETVCPGEQSMVSVPGSFSGWIWKNDAGNTLTNPTPLLGVGNYTLQVNDENGCESTTSFSIAGLPGPDAAIEAQTGNICQGDIVIFALQTADGYQYEWFKDNTLTGSDSPIFNATEAGAYVVKVTDTNGCTAFSNAVNLMPCDTTASNDDDPNGDGTTDPGSTGTGCIPAAALDFDYQSVGSCGSFYFENTSTNYVSGSLVWQFKDVLGQIIDTATGETANFVFNSPGDYFVTLTGQVPELDSIDSYCDVAKTISISMSVTAKFSSTTACTGMPVMFTDLSTFFPTDNLVAWDWDFGDPASGQANSSNLQHPSHVYGQAGTYTVLLNVTTSTGCTVPYTKDVTIVGFPTVNFAPPATVCEAIALNFVANSSNGAISYAWDFGDPASGNGNSSQNQSTWHAYPAAGNYTVTVTAANAYGCTASYTSNVAIQANDLTGNITPEAPAPMCEGQTTYFTAPSGGASWIWSNGATSSSISVAQAGIYAVTLTDAEGCKYKPEPVGIEVIPGPTAVIRAVELNEFGQPVAYHPAGYTACEGEEVYLEMNGDIKYTYLWSDGSTGEQLVFSEANGSSLPAGQHSFTVTVTDALTGCTSVEGPFPVTVYAAPVAVAIASSPPGPLCDGTEAVFNVVNPDASLNYLWNTGDINTSMSAAAAGSYLVQATNQFGCSAKSNEIEIFNAPSVGNVPTGCFNRCNPTVICLPQMPEIADYQWFLNGTAIAAPEGTVANYEATESGDYQVQMTSIYGCISLSGQLSLSLEAPTGDITGMVWLDANNNGIIDPADTPLPDIGVLLTQNATGTGGIILDSLTSGPSGGFVFEEIPSENYTVELDPSSIPSTLLPLATSANASLSGCHDSTGVQFLLKNLCFLPIANTVQLGACQGNSANYNGVDIPAGESQQFILTSFYGCDSVVTVNVAAYPLGVQQLGLVFCPGEPIVFDGQTLTLGDTTTFVYQDLHGCDSTVVVTAELFQAIPPTVLAFSICPGDSLNYNGETLWPGSVRNYAFKDQNGCDSVVNLSVTAYPAIAFELFADAICPGTSDGGITVEPSAGDGPLTASLDGLGFGPVSAFEGLFGGMHTVQVQDIHDCIVSQNIEIQELAPLTLATEDYVLPCDKPLVTLRPTVLSHTGPLHWQWADGSDREWFHATQPGVFPFTVGDDCSTAERTVTVAWGDNVPAEYFYMPNAFSPNGDGINDSFQAYPAQGVAFLSFELLVFDRWGALLFQSNDPATGWDGNFKGKPMDTGVVAWYVNASISVCGREVEVFKEGGVAVVR